MFRVRVATNGRGARTIWEMVWSSQSKTKTPLGHFFTGGAAHCAATWPVTNIFASSAWYDFSPNFVVAVSGSEANSLPQVKLIAPG